MSSSLAVEKLEESQQLQHEIAAGQRDSLEYQRQLVENGTFLSQAIEASRGSVQEMMEEFKLLVIYHEETKPSKYRELRLVTKLSSHWPRWPRQSSDTGTQLFTQTSPT